MDKIKNLKNAFISETDKKMLEEKKKQLQELKSQQTTGVFSVIHIKKNRQTNQQIKTLEKEIAAIQDRQKLKIGIVFGIVFLVLVIAICFIGSALEHDSGTSSAITSSSKFSTSAESILPSMESESIPSSEQAPEADSVQEEAPTVIPSESSSAPDSLSDETSTSESASSRTSPTVKNEVPSANSSTDTSKTESGAIEAPSTTKAESSSADISTSDATVWVPTNGGTKYHTHANCSNMNDPIQMTQSQAIDQGFTPCKRCH